MTRTTIADSMLNSFSLSSIYHHESADKASMAEELFFFVDCYLVLELYCQSMVVACWCFI